MLNDTQKFAVDLLGQFPTGNVFISPLSIRSAMGRAMIGARGKTRKQMEDVLRFGGTDDEIVSWLKEQDARITGLKQITFQVANRLYAQKGYGFDPSFVRRMAEMASFEQVDFTRNYEAVRLMINEWVQQQTHDKITNLLAEGSLDSLTRLVIVNAVYFLGNWASQFKKGWTQQASFNTADDGFVQVPLMHQEQTFPYAENEKAQALIMPYVGGELGMLTILPKKGKSGFDLTQDWGDLVPRLRPTKVEVYYPKFKMDWGTENLVPAFQAMGMQDAFSTEADFTGVVPNDGLQIDGVYHKTFIKVDEEGTEAAAATAVALSRSTSVAATPEFRADHPFVYSIVAIRNSYQPQFIGRMENPTK